MVIITGKSEREGWGGEVSGLLVRKLVEGIRVGQI